MEYDIILIYVYIDDPNVCIERVRVRVKKGGHNIPDEDIRRRYDRSLSNFYNKYKDLVEDWAIYYNGQTDFIAVAKSEGDNIEVVDEVLYNEFTERF